MSIKSRALNQLEKVGVRVLGDADPRPRPPIGDAEPAARGAVDREFAKLVDLVELKLEREARAAAEEAARKADADDAAEAGAAADAADDAGAGEVADASENEAAG